MTYFSPAMWFLLFALVVVIIQFIRNKDTISPKIYDSEKIEEYQTYLTKELLNEFNVQIVDFLKKYIDTLILKSKQLTYKDDYGDYNFDDWFNEIEKFTENKMWTITENISEQIQGEIDVNFNFSKYRNPEKMNRLVHEGIESRIKYELVRFIDAYVQENNIKQLEKKMKELDKSGDGNNLAIVDYNIDDPILFEKSVAENFEIFNWETFETKTTGDQGADVIAKINDTKCIVQCKLYSQPVGNKAVQEVISAREFYNGDLALVLTNASFTKSAKQLASSTNVELLHYSELSQYLEHVEI